MNGLVAEVALKGTTFAFDKLYSYAIPPELHTKALAGCRVTVPFGRSNTKKQGIIFKIRNDELKGLKKISSVTDDTAVLTEEMLGLCEYMHETVFCNYYDAVSAMLPAGLDFKTVNYFCANTEFSGVSLLSETEAEIYGFLAKKGETAENVLKSTFVVTGELLDTLAEKQALIKTSDYKRKIGDATQKWVRLCDDYTADIKLTARQMQIAELLNDIGSASVKEICYFTGVSVSVIDTLVKKGVLIQYEKPVFRTAYSKIPCDNSEILLTDEQQLAFDGMMKQYRSPKGETSLLYGVTGSGKTKVYLKLTDEIVAMGKGVIVMVPEISLTPQLISIFSARYGDKIAVFHSAMSMGKRLDEWKRIKEGKALIAIGTRSAVFAPFKDLGLIIIDEEQEHTYKSEKSPRFHARDLARYRIGFHKGLLCLASATPAIESYSKALSGAYSLYTLKNRYGNAVLPTVETVDMRKEIRNGNTGVLSNALYEELSEVLDNKKQAILLLNRRGHNTYISCAECGYVETCPNCSVSLTYHSANNRLMCHYCGFSKPNEKVCPQCQSEHIKFMGLGTQKAEEELKILFPKAKILRLDADSTSARDSFSEYLTDFADGKYDILLGTQMVAKGLNFPNVTLVGVLGADMAAYSEDFRSFERSFSLLTQVVGRAGRGETAGKAVIQTVNPESNLIELAENQDYDSFYNEEILTRKLMVYPPYCDICLVSVQALSRDIAESTVNQIFKNIKTLINDEFTDVKVIILGPAPAAIPKVNNRYRFRMIIKCKNNLEFRKMLRKATQVKLLQDACISVDINPETII